MLCCLCKEREAKVHLTQIIGDKVQKVDLCEQCAAAKGLNGPAFSLADLVLGLGASQHLEQAGGGPGLRCPRCGYVQAEFKKSGRLGCPDCYTTFAEGLAGMLKTMHKGTRHVGKSPRGQAKSRDLTERIKVLQRRLEKAIKEEDFEEAAVVRDEIKAVKEQLTAASGS